MCETIERRRYDEIGMDAIAKMRNAQADKSVMGILGEDWAKQQQVEILKGIANNEGGGVATAGAGLGMGLAAGIPYLLSFLIKLYLL